MEECVCVCKNVSMDECVCVRVEWGERVCEGMYVCKGVSLDECVCERVCVCVGV